MTEKHLLCRPTWYRYAVLSCLLVAMVVDGYVKSHNSGILPGIPIAAFLFLFGYQIETSTKICWNEKSIWLFSRLFKIKFGEKKFINFSNIENINTGFVSGERISDREIPFTTIKISDKNDFISIRTNIYYRDGIQDLISDIVRARPDLPLTENLEAYLRGDLDDYWPK